MKTRVRACDKPVPAFGGKNCSELGPASETISCNEQKCPGNVLICNFLSHGGLYLNHLDYP